MPLSKGNEMADAASRRTKTLSAAAIAFMCCVTVGACTGLTEPPSEVAATPVYLINGASAARTEMRQEIPEA